MISGYVVLGVVVVAASYIAVYVLRMENQKREVDLNEDDLDEEVDDMLAERFIGSPDECIDRIAKFRDGAGVDHVIAMYNRRQLS